MDAECAAIVTVPSPDELPVFGYCALLPGRSLTIQDEAWRTTHQCDTLMTSLPASFQLDGVGTINVLHRGNWMLTHGGTYGQVVLDSSLVHLAWQQLPGAVVSPCLMAESIRSCDGPNAFTRRLHNDLLMTGRTGIPCGIPFVPDPLVSHFDGEDDVLEFDTPFLPCECGQSKVETVRVYRNRWLDALAFRMNVADGRTYSFHVDIIVPDDPAREVTPSDWTQVHRDLDCLDGLEMRATITLPLLQIDTSFAVTEEGHTLQQRVVCNIAPTGDGAVASEPNTVQIDCRERLFHLRIMSRGINTIVMWGVFNQ